MSNRTEMSYRRRFSVGRFFSVAAMLLLRFHFDGSGIAEAFSSWYSSSTGWDFSTCYQLGIGNGLCDMINNNAGCAYDGGDCCCGNDLLIYCEDPGAPLECKYVSSSIVGSSSGGYSSGVGDGYTGYYNDYTYGHDTSSSYTADDDDANVDDNAVHDDDSPSTSTIDDPTLPPAAVDDNDLDDVTPPPSAVDDDDLDDVTPPPSAVDGDNLGDVTSPPSAADEDGFGNVDDYNGAVSSDTGTGDKGSQSGADSGNANEPEETDLIEDYETAAAGGVTVDVGVTAAMVLLGLLGVVLIMLSV